MAGELAPILLGVPQDLPSCASTWGYSLDTDLVFLLLIATFLPLHCLA